MCFDLESLPPIPVLAGAAVTHERLELRASDGNRFAAFAAMPEQRGAAGVVILPDVRGLYRFYEELALRFAERGIGALAFDYFGRTAGAGTRDDDFEYMPHVEQTTQEGLEADVAAAVERLRGDGYERIFTVGFCFGGRNSWLAAASGKGITGAVGFYGRPKEGRPPGPGPIERAGDMEAPVLALMGGADPAIPVEDVEDLKRAWEDAGVEHEVVVYDGAPHSFFDRKYEEFADASDDAWRRTLDFVERISG